MTAQNSEVVVVTGASGGAGRAIALVTGPWLVLTMVALIGIGAAELLGGSAMLGRLAIGMKR